MKSEKYPILVYLLVYLLPNFYIYENTGPSIGQKTFSFSNHYPPEFTFLKTN